MATRRIVILGAAGRDFRNFNVVYRDDPTAVVVAFTATQIPGDRRQPPPPFRVGAFSGSRATALVGVTAAVGYVLGVIGAGLWNAARTD